MRKVAFPFLDRLEMGTAWAAPMSVVAALVFLPLWKAIVLPLIAMIWGLNMLIFLMLPLYERFLKKESTRIAFLAVLWGLVFLGIFVSSVLSAGFSWSFILRWGIASLVVILILSVDLAGSTPALKTGLHGEPLLAVELDTKKCRGAGFCFDVCPRGCFEVDRPRRTASMPRAELCVRCVTCIVQCPFNVLCFASPAGDRITPQIVLRYKLNLMGKRRVSI